MSDHPHQQPADPDEPDFAAMLASLLGGADNPEVAKALGAMGIDKIDPATMGMIGAQLKAMFSGGVPLSRSTSSSPPTWLASPLPHKATRAWGMPLAARSSRPSRSPVSGSTT